MTALLTGYYYGEHVRVEEITGSTAFVGNRKILRKKFWMRNLNRKGQFFGLPSCDECSFEMGDFLNWIHRATERSHLLDLVKKNNKFSGIVKARKFLTAL